MTSAAKAPTPIPAAPRDGHGPHIAAACRRIEACVKAGAPAPTLHDLAQPSGLSPFHFHRLFKRATGVTPAAYARGLKAGRAAAALTSGGG